MNVKAIGILVVLWVSTMVSSAMADQHKLNISEDALVKSIAVSASELSDSTGLSYVGGIVQQDIIAGYLQQLQAIETDAFKTLRAGQANRDHGKFHVTLINPYEIKEVSEQQVNALLASGRQIKFQVKGLGRVIKDQGKAYFVVLSSEQADDLRKAFGLAPKDFHITLGFSPSDIYGVSKDESTLVKVSP
ncbi:hypothetical protein [Thalassotalea euphylliae]|uniref:Swiss Army Knife 2H phosphoesterase domain-containing protein n=1 Tax=Thalassotalea euphylliae TaxID=1655234 RepID=A0A3E0TZS0_9GAMM|nr:hypothetical protein [Thalassotalea euphylliae]REL29964.1 hypothetical protein DXX94_04165 [Thalassotalea euphylliae]